MRETLDAPRGYHTDRVFRFDTAFGAAEHGLGDIDGSETGLSTLVQVLAYRGLTQPDDLAFTFLKDGETATTPLTYGDLDRQARAVGAALRQRGATGQRVLLLFPQSIDFIVAFFGTLAAGAAAVPAPHAQGSRASAARLQAIALDARPVLTLTTPALLDETTAAIARLKGTIDIVPIVTTIEALLEEGRGLTSAHAAMPDPDSVALVQYTSGSTGTPRGVVITHANILHNQSLIRARFEHARQAVVVGWLPMFHDMGLIGNLLQPIYIGCSCVLMSPAAFLEEPVRWLRAMTRYRGTTAGAPNFAYDFCVDRIPAADRADLDLRSWDIAYNGSEPVRARTLDRFAAAFAPFGFRKSAFYPCYGMAESTLLIAGPAKATAPARHLLETAGQAPRSLVGCGVTAEGHDILIVNPDTCQPMPDGTVGEIWFAGPSVAQGYWNRPAETAATFCASPADRSDPRWLRTGDLGFIAPANTAGASASPELFVTGRIKDVMILRGRNHYPQDIETTAQASHAGLRPDCGAAFLIEETTEGGKDRQAVILVHEVSHAVLRDPPLAEIAGAVRAAVSREHGLHIAAVVLLKPGALPKTTSGKIQRRLSKSRYIAGDLPVLAQDRHGPAFWTTAQADADARTD